MGVPNHLFFSRIAGTAGRRDSETVTQIICSPPMGSVPKTNGRVGPDSPFAILSPILGSEIPFFWKIPFLPL